MMQAHSGSAGIPARIRLFAFPVLAEPDADDAQDGDDAMPVLDVAQFARLRALMPPRGLEQFLSSYLLDAEFQLAEIARAQGPQRIAAAARLLASLAAEAGAMQTRAAARRLEEACRGRDPRRIRRFAAALRQSCARADRLLRGFLAAQP
jgi:hypothetical protein